MSMDSNAGMAQESESANELYRRLTPKSAGLHKRAGNSLAGSRLDPASKALHPIRIDHGTGPYLYDIDGRRYINFWNAYNVHLFGHDNKVVAEAIRRQMENGVFMHTPMPADVELAELIIDRCPSADKVIFTSTGTEATMMALRIARAYMNRDKIAKFDGGYHGWHETVMVNPGGRTADSMGRWRPGEKKLGLGVPRVLAGETEILTFNDIADCERVLQEHGDEFAAVIMEPFMTSAMITPTKDFLSQMRELTSRYGVLLIFDEVSSFGLGTSGAQGYYGVTPDLTALGKVIGGGMPIGAVGGRSDIMAILESTTPPFVFATGGTFSRHPLSMVAGAAYLNQLTPEVFADVHRKGDDLRNRLGELFTRLDAPLTVTGVGQFYCIHTLSKEPQNWAEFMESDQILKSKIMTGFKNRGYWMVDGRGMLTTVLDDGHISAFVDALEQILHEVL